MRGKKFELQITGPTTAYLRLPTYPENLQNAKSVTLASLLAYKGPYVVFDFDSGGVLVGIELVGDDEEEGESEGEATDPPTT